MLKWVLFLVAVGLALTVGALATLKTIAVNRESVLQPAPPNCISALDDGYEAFASEISLVEDSWGQPIPEDLHRIGGLDWWGWARVCREDGVWRGAYWDQLLRYEGRFEFVTADGAPAGFDPVGSYYLSHYDRERGLLLYRIEPEEPPVSYYFMRLAEPDLLERWQPDG